MTNRCGLSGSAPLQQQLTRLLYPLAESDRLFREQVMALLATPTFVPQPGLTSEQSAMLSYARFRYLRQSLDLRVSDVTERPARVMTLLELAGTVDGTLFTIMSIHYCLCAGSILRHGAGSPELAPFLAELDSLESIGTYLLTELGFGSNVVALQTRADYDASRREVVLNTPSAAAIKFMPNTGLNGVPKLAVVLARLFVNDRDEGVFPVVVRLRTASEACPGIGIRMLGEKPAYALDNAMTTFRDVRVPEACLLLGSESALSPQGLVSRIKSKRERFLNSIEQVQLGRLSLSGASAALTGASAFIAIKYAEQRRTFAPRREDVSVLEYRNCQRDLFTALAYTYASRLMVNAAQRECEATRSSEHDRIFRITSATKAHVTYAAEHFIRRCRERCGAVGLLEENRISAYANYCPGLITAEGDNQIVLLKIARQMLLGRGYPSPDVPVLEAGLSLTDRARQSALFRERERLLLGELRGGMAARLRGRNAFDIWNDQVNLALETATAHASRLAFEAFAEPVAALGDDHPAALLLRLFGLEEIARHLGFFLAEGLISVTEVKSYHALVGELCRQLRPHALTLAEAFDIPNSVLRAPIASDDYIATYSALTTRAVLAAPSPQPAPPPAFSSRSSSAHPARSLPGTPAGNQA
jgi:acyl-CoA oxidase